MHWITRFAEEGGDAILTADKDFVKRDAQVATVFNTGIKVILLPKRWGQMNRRLQAAHILKWWEKIEQTITEMGQRECYSPRGYIGDAPDLVKVKLDFSKAHQGVRRQSTRSTLRAKRG